MKTAILLSILGAGIAPVASQLRLEQSSHTDGNERELNGRSTFESFFEIGFATAALGHHADLPMAAQTLATAYNDLVKDNFDDPFDRRMDKVEILEVDTRRKLTDEEVRNLQFASLNALVRVVGNCRGCRADSSFTLQLGQRPPRPRDRRLRSSSKSSKSSSNSRSNSGSRSSSNSGKGGKGESLPMLPTEQELLDDFSRKIRRMDMLILDVVSLREREEPRMEVEVEQGKGTGGKNSSSESSSKSGKKSGKKSDKKSSKTSGEKSDKKSGKTSKSSKSSGKGKGSVRPTCPPVEPVGSFTGQFTTFFRSLFALLMESNVGLEDGAAALTIAYNRVAERYAADIIMEESFPFDPVGRRRLSFQEVQLRRNLQLRLDFNIEVIGFCTGCGQQMTFGNQVSTRRQLDDDGLNCLLPGLPTEDEVKFEYNKVLVELDIPNIEECVELEEMDQVSYESCNLPLRACQSPSFSHYYACSFRTAGRG
jgi:hypothetical protein